MRIVQAGAHTRPDSFVVAVPVALAEHTWLAMLTPTLACKNLWPASESRGAQC